MFRRPCRWSVPRRSSRLRVDLGAVQVNQLQGNPAELWTMPSYPGSPLVDLGIRIRPMVRRRGCRPGR